MSKLIVVVGATGNQGGSVVDAFRKDKSWTVRAITRDTSSPKAQSLSAKGGVEVVAADLKDVASLQQAFVGAHTIFGVTNWDWNIVFDPETQAKLQPGQIPQHLAFEDELQLGRNIFDAAAETASLQRLIFSGLSDATKWSGGKYKGVYHFDTKAQTVKYGRETYPALWRKTSVIQMGWFLSNWLLYPGLKPTKDKNGTFNFPVSVPSSRKLPFISPTTDAGRLVYCLAGQTTAGHNLIAYRAYTTIEDIAHTFGRVHDVPVKCTPASLDGPFADPSGFSAGFAENMKYFAEFGYEAVEDPTLVHPRQLEDPPVLGTLEDWVRGADWSAVLHQDPEPERSQADFTGTAV